MSFSYLLFFEDDRPDGAIARGDLAAVREVVAAIAGLARAHLFTPARAHDPHGAAQPAPFFGLQLDFATLADLEAAMATAGPLGALAALPSLAGADASQQAMRRHDFAVPEAAALAAEACSYCVHYPGPSPDDEAWRQHYVAHHVPIMARLPGVRAVEVLTPVAWRGGLPWRRADHMLRNRVVFDSPAALAAALASPVRHQMRADFEAFLPYDGGAFHHPFATEIVSVRRR